MDMFVEELDAVVGIWVAGREGIGVFKWINVDWGTLVEGFFILQGSFSPFQ
ncbi:hypothetical protein PY093_18730 [Cytobacillus sp. S13-E01]|uniref:hypothetical protein n=1 Tax=Cytobacillus sp. S13-E01 TaxID=3031326 RepID=UPI0023D85A85|nr:hypothetical protein [Cytobacillus sp. S13-E01]MDF0728664.1 hypothetical protein [Cytobacillus sp. S13-E01]